MHVVVSEAGASTSIEIERVGLDTEKYFVVQNKIDLAGERRSDATVHVSARTGEGLESLRRHILGALTASSGDAVDIARDRPAITNVRHAALVERAHAALTRAGDAARAVPIVAEEFLLADLQQARAALEEIAGRRAPEDLLEHIFARFCVGK
jgi:tRNA modification GTPase